MNILFSKILFAVNTVIFSSYTFAFDADNVLEHIRKASKVNSFGVNALAAPPAAGVILANEKNRLDEEEKAKFELYATCDGRFGVLNVKLDRQISRAEWVSVIGGTVGVLGAVATCPHCAALAAGMAGLANPLQQTFRDNADSPQDTQAALNRLSLKINEELERYSKLPPADPGTQNFNINMQARLDALFVATASCRYYDAFLYSSATKNAK